MSRIDNATLVMNVTTGANAAKFRIYAFSNNVLRVLNGMGGLALMIGQKSTLVCQNEIRQTQNEFVVSKDLFGLLFEHPQVLVECY